MQRRILHAMKEMDDYRFNKVANIIGQSMQYHPHGDASISDALVNPGQKDLLIRNLGVTGVMCALVMKLLRHYIETRLEQICIRSCL